MRRTPLYLAAWVAAGAGAIALTTTAVGLVGNQVTDSRPSPLSADEVRDELAQETTTSTTVAGATTTAPTTTSTTQVAPTATTATPAPAETRTYPLIGGTATLRFAPTGVTVVVANPNPGYSVSVAPSHGNGVEVEFESDGHRSKVEGWWSGGPQDEVDERDEDAVESDSSDDD